MENLEIHYGFLRDVVYFTGWWTYGGEAGYAFQWKFNRFQRFYVKLLTQANKACEAMSITLRFTAIASTQRWEKNMKSIMSNRTFSWVLWIYILFSLLASQVIFGRGISFGIDQGMPNLILLGLSFCSLILSVFCRWVMVPWFRNQYLIIISVIFGLSMGIQVEFIQLFMIREEYPMTQLILLILSLIAIIQYYPPFLRRYLT